MKKNILKKFEHIGSLESETLIDELKNYASITEKLDYLKHIKESYLDKYFGVLKTLSLEEQKFIIDNDGFVLKTIYKNFEALTPSSSQVDESNKLIPTSYSKFDGSFKPIPRISSQVAESLNPKQTSSSQVDGSFEIKKSLFITENLFKIYFSEYINNPEFTFWILKFYAKIRFDEYTTDRDWLDKLKKPKKEYYVRAELKKILDIEKSADRKILDGKINVYKKYSEEGTLYFKTNKDIPEIETHRVRNNYYENHVTEDSCEIYRSPGIEAYFKHKLLKTYLKSLLKDINEQNKISPDNILTRESLLNEPNNLIPEVTIPEVLNHFEVLTKTTNRKDKFYLTPKQLLTFVKSTFIDLTPVEQNFKCSFSKDKIDVRSVFRKFQNMCMLREKNNKHLKQKYYEILVKSFKGFNQTDFDKWHVTNNKISTIAKLKSK